MHTIKIYYDLLNFLVMLKTNELHIVFGLLRHVQLLLSTLRTGCSRFNVFKILSILSDSIYKIESACVNCSLDRTRL